MKKREKTLKKIIHNATILFGEKGYFATSISDISKKADISKGILYYYVKNKDELYMKCLEECATKLHAFLSIEYEKVETLCEYATLRDSFIKQNPIYDKILFYLMAQKPDCLSSRISELKTPIFVLDKKACIKFFNNVKLGNNILIDDALFFLSIVEQSIPSLINANLDKPISEMLSRVMEIYLNGLKHDLA